MSGLGSMASGTAFIAEESRPPAARGRAAAGRAPRDPLDDLAHVLGRRAAAAADELDAVLRTNPASASASASGDSLYTAWPSSFSGMPALGRTET